MKQKTEVSKTQVENSGILSYIKDYDVAEYVETLAMRDKNIFQFLCEQQYVPESIQDLRYFLQNHYLLEDTTSPIHVNVALRGGVEKPFIITQTNFYNGYHTKIWSKLSLQERAKITNWHFEQRKKEMGEKRIKLFFFPDEMDIFDYDGLAIEDEEIFVNASLLKGNAVEVIKTVDHELTHVKQFLYGVAYASPELTPEQTNTMFDYVCNSQMAMMDNILTTKIQEKFLIKNYDMLYTHFLIEEKAEKRSTKMAKKILNLNKKTIGLDKQMLQDIITSDQNYDKRMYAMDDKKIDLVAQKVSKKFDYLTKLAFYKNLLVRKFHNYNKLLTNTELENVPKVQQDIVNLQQKIKNLDNVIDKFLTTGNKPKPTKESKEAIDYFVE